MISREEIFAYAKEKYGVQPDYPWARTPNFAILRHGGSRKWFGAIVDITEDKLGLPGHALIDALSVKCDPLLIGQLRKEEGIFPAYHMNKEHWITIRLDSPISMDRVAALIDFSFELTK